MQARQTVRCGEWDFSIDDKRHHVYIQIIEYRWDKNRVMYIHLMFISIIILDSNKQKKI